MIKQTIGLYQRPELWIPQRIVITGGPGIGKTTILNELANKGYTTVPEAARIVIEESQRTNSDCLPWLNLPKFQIAVREKQLSLEEIAAKQATGNFQEIFCDRGILDNIAYQKIGKIPFDERIIEIAKGRYDAIFMPDQLPATLYKNDSARTETREESIEKHNIIRETYIEFGYNPISVPVLSPTERANFILNVLKGGDNKNGK